MNDLMFPFYDPKLSYETNYQNGPFGVFAQDPQPQVISPTAHQFLNYQVNLPFGIPAGPLLNANFIKAAFKYGFDLCTYKTVRTRSFASQPFPNILAVHPLHQDLKLQQEVLADQNFTMPLAMTNSFGVPSADPNVWQTDLALAVKAAHKGQLVIGSFQGTSTPRENLAKDYALAARLVAETGVPILEANLSCPNEGSSELLCYDLPKVIRIAHQIKEAVPELPLFLKLAYFLPNQDLKALVNNLNQVVSGYTVINTMAAFPVNTARQPALGPQRPIAGICGEPIRWAGLAMVQRLNHLRQESGLDFTIIGVGGVTQVKHYQQYRQAGADAVLSATGAMWRPLLAQELKQSQL